MISYYLSIVETEDERNKVTHIYTKYYSFMCCIAAKYLSNKSDIEDIVHDSMLKIIDRLDTIDISADKKLRSLCGVIVKHKAIDSTRLKKNNTEPLDEVFPVIDEGSSPEEIVIKEDTYQIILSTIRALEDKYKNVCILRYVNGLNDKEISNALDISENSVRVRLYRARSILKKRLLNVR
ncbi:MAG: sigma-70 family RNA polymerase sigma factor [Clostridia bacterium]|nr:sigma-70 family RNA polymerase sigma factor [Clostridia bacterium]